MILKTNKKTVKEVIESILNVEIYVSDGNVCYKNPKSNIILDKRIKFYRIHNKENKFDNNYVYVRI